MWIGILYVIFGIDIILGDLTAHPYEPLVISKYVIKTESEAVIYLNQSGYDPCNRFPTSIRGQRIVPCRYSPKLLLQLFQREYGLPITGKLDENTLEIINRHRCRFAEKTAHASTKTEFKIWTKTNLTWKLNTDVMPTIGEGKVRSLLRESFNDWSKYAPLTFREVTNDEKADFDLGFTEKRLPDGKIFDSMNKVIAYAHSPQSGKIRFNVQVPWTDGYDANDLNFRVTATHEIGHALGLSHSSDRSAIMFSAYSVFRPDQMLPIDDQKAIQNLYGERLVESSLDDIENPVSHVGERGVVWVKEKLGSVPLNAYIAGTENQHRVFAVRVKVRNGRYLIGKLVEGQTMAQYSDMGVKNSSVYEVLTDSTTNSTFQWSQLRGSILPRHAVPANSTFEPDAQYIARVHHPSGAICIGYFTMSSRICFYFYRNHRFGATNNCEILCFR